MLIKLLFFLLNFIIIIIIINFVLINLKKTEKQKRGMKLRIAAACKQRTEQPLAANMEEMFEVLGLADLHIKGKRGDSRKKKRIWTKVWEKRGWRLQNLKRQKKETEQGRRAEVRIRKKEN